MCAHTQMGEKAMTFQWPSYLLSTEAGCFGASSPLLYWASSLSIVPPLFKICCNWGSVAWSPASPVSAKLKAQISICHKCSMREAFLLTSLRAHLLHFHTHLFAGIDILVLCPLEWSALGPGSNLVVVIRFIVSPFRTGDILISWL